MHFCTDIEHNNNNNLYPGRPGWAGTKTLETLTTLIVHKFLTSTPNLSDLSIYF